MTVCTLLIVNARRVIDPSKVLLTSRMRLRLNGVGVVDIVKFDAHKQGDQATALAQVTIKLMYTVNLVSFTFTVF